MGSRLQGTVVAITGAGSGMGAATARAMSDEGAKLGILDYDLAAAEAVASSIRDAGGDAVAVGVDVRDREQMSAALAAVVAAHGRLDVMVNNAGISAKLPFMETTEDDFRRLHDVNVIGVLIGMQEAAKIFIEQGGGGKIIVACSVAARQANAEFAAYAASKFAARSLVQSGARALAPYRTVVTGYAPGIVDTPLWRGNFDSEEARLAALERYEERIPAGRLSMPEDVAPVIVFLASSDADYMTGQVVAVDGGLEMV